MRVKKEIEEYSAKEDKPILLWLLSRYSRESRWRFVAGVTNQRYGKLSYETRRVWYPTEEGKLLYKYWPYRRGNESSKVETIPQEPIRYVDDVEDKKLSKSFTEACHDLEI